MLKYHLTENLLTNHSAEYVAQVQTAGSYNKEALIEEMLKRGTLLTRTDILAVLNGLEEVVCDIVSSGGTINSPLFNTSFSISGVFDGPIDNFDGNRHKLNVNISKGTKLRATESKVSFEKTTVMLPQPQILEVKDSVSKSINTRLTAGGVVEVFGNNIKVGGDHADCGLWFVPATGEPTKATTLVQNKPGSIIAVIPQLPTGSYTLKIITQQSGGGILLKTPRICLFGKTLTVS